MYHTAGSVCTVVKAAINRLTEMPTRIALSKQSAPKVVVAQGTTTSRINTVKATASPNVLPPSAENDDANPISTSSQAQSLRKQPRQLPTFRSSILRDLKKGADSTVETERMVTDDIRASPRLLGYLFSMMAGAVMLVSVVQYVLIAMPALCLLID